MLVYFLPFFSTTTMRARITHAPETRKRKKKNFLIFVLMESVMIDFDLAG